jgi:hypothetical protein
VPALKRGHVLGLLVGDPVEKVSSSVDHFSPEGLLQLHGEVGLEEQASSHVAEGAIFLFGNAIALLDVWGTMLMFDAFAMEELGNLGVAELCSIVGPDQHSLDLGFGVGGLEHGLDGLVDLILCLDKAHHSKSTGLVLECDKILGPPK